MLDWGYFLSLCTQIIKKVLGRPCSLRCLCLPGCVDINSQARWASVCGEFHVFPIYIINRVGMCQGIPLIRL
jgi:hypothetical protein